MVTDPKEIQIGEIVDLDLKQVFPREDTSFTPWLSLPKNLSRLSTTLGFELEVLDTEVRSETFRVDILARRTMDDALVIIENQFGRSDHGHLGQTLTYLAAHGAKTVIWIAERFADEHRKAVEWLNENTGDEYSFYAVVPRLIQIGDSAPGLRFELDVKPNHSVKALRSTNRKLANETFEIRTMVWQAVRTRLDEWCAGSSTRYGGRQGHLWIIPPNAPMMNGRDVHILLYLNLPRAGAQRLNYFISCGQHLDTDAGARAATFVKKVWRTAVECMDANDIDVGSIYAGQNRAEAGAAYFEADLRDEGEIEACLDLAMPAVQAVYHALQSAIDTNQFS